jgi:1,2-phenylacetyl-CoA epoxidase PaaB subunit
MKGPTSKGSNGQVYEVFARKTHEDELKHVGSVNANDDDLAKAYAWTLYDEESWVEMCVVPRRAVIPINPHGPLPLWGN